MAKDCFNVIVFRCNKEKPILDFLNKINTLLENNKREFVDLMESYNLNVDDYDGSGFKGSFRGQIIHCDDYLSYNDEEDEYYFYMDTETAWLPLMNTFDIIIKHTDSEIKYYYTSEEPGMGIYINTDSSEIYLTPRFNVYLDYSNKVNISEGLQTFEECYRLIYDAMGWKFNNLKQAKERLRKFTKKCKYKKKVNFYFDIQEYSYD